MATKSLYVGNLPYSTTEEELRRLYEPWGPVGSIRLFADKGFAFVDVPAESAAEANKNTSGQELNGRPLRVDEARPRPERVGSRRGFGGDRGEY